jgi:hypothetical protein
MSAAMPSTGIDRADLNIAMKWLSCPGRSNGAADAEEVDFAPAAGRR